MRLILASKSPSRAMLLRQAGVAFDMASSGVDEDAVKARMIAAGEGPRAVAEALAVEKALAVSRTTDGLVIGADQTLDLAGALMDKADSAEEARERLTMLRGRVHSLHSAVAVARGDAVLWRETRSAMLSMRPFSDAYLDGYMARNGERILSSVGCYQLEGEGAQLFDAVEGDYFTILGLPLFGLFAFLRAEGVMEP